MPKLGGISLLRGTDAIGMGSSQCRSSSCHAASLKNTDSSFFSYVLSWRHTDVSPGRWSTDLNLHLILAGKMLFLSLGSRHENSCFAVLLVMGCCLVGLFLRVFFLFFFFPLLSLGGA